MIRIYKDVVTEVPFTLFEKQTIPYSAMTQYVIEFYSKKDHSNTLISLPLTADTTTNNARYNRFPINLTSFTGTTMSPGQYNYFVYQTTGSTLTISGLTTSDVLESGLCDVIGTGTTQTTYIKNKDEYTFL